MKVLTREQLFAPAKRARRTNSRLERAKLVIVAARDGAVETAQQRAAPPIKRPPSIINGFEVHWASERVFAEQQTAPNYGYLFEVSADRKRIVRCAHISAIGGDSDNLDGDAERLEKDARQAVEEFLGCQRESGGLLGGWWRRRQKSA